MKKTIRIIDLLNDLFDYRETMPYKLPKKIKFNNIEFEFKDMSYYSEDGNNIMSYIDHTLDLRVQVEILDEEEFEDIRCLENEKEFYTYTEYENYKNDIDKILYILKAINITEEKINKLNNQTNQLIRNQKKILEKLNKNNNTQ